MISKGNNKIRPTGIGYSIEKTTSVIQAIFSAASLLFILAPLYVAIGFGWRDRAMKLDVMMSLSILISVCVPGYVFTW